MKPLIIHLSNQSVMEFKKCSPTDALHALQGDGDTRFLEYDPWANEPMALSSIADSIRRLGMSKVAMDTDAPNYISEMIEMTVEFHPARVQSPEAMAMVWGNKMMALSNLAIANELSKIREVLRTMSPGGFPGDDDKS